MPAPNFLVSVATSHVKWGEIIVELLCSGRENTEMALWSDNLKKKKIRVDGPQKMLCSCLHSCSSSATGKKKKKSPGETTVSESENIKIFCV